MSGRPSEPAASSVAADLQPGLSDATYSAMWRGFGYVILVIAFGQARRPLACVQDRPAGLPEVLNQTSHDPASLRVRSNSSRAAECAESTNE